MPSGRRRLRFAGVWSKLPGMRFAFFISPHGLGHAAREAAVMDALRRRDPGLGIEIFTTVHESFFRESLRGPFGYHREATDIGLVQTTSLHEDVGATVERLDAFLPFDETVVERLAKAVARCDAVVCDISPLGIAAARRAGVRSILIESFTWHWIYAGYGAAGRGLERHSRYLREITGLADVHIQTRPVCEPAASADLLTAPVARVWRTPRAEIREALGVGDDRRTVLITMGGTQDRFEFLDVLADARDLDFVVLGAGKRRERRHNLLLLPLRHGFYHPDLTNACDYVVGKVGYSTIAEVYHAGVPFGYVTRPHNRECDALARFVAAEMPSVRLPHEEFFSGAWVTHLPQLLALERVERQEPNGADAIAEFLLPVR